MILLYAFLINLLLGALTTLLVYSSQDGAREAFEELATQSGICKFIVLTRAFMLNHWEYLFDWLTYLVYKPSDGEDDGETDS